jgi:hypothetical protein
MPSQIGKHGVAERIATHIKKGFQKENPAKSSSKMVKKEAIDGSLSQLYMVQKPYTGCQLTSLVQPIDPLVGLGGSEIVPDKVHGVFPDQDMALQVATELYEAYCDEQNMLEEKKGKVGDKLKKTIDHLEKKRKEHVDMAKEDPKNASKHKEHIAKIATQIDDLMSKMERIEKSKKNVEKADDKKQKKEDLKESISVGSKVGDKIVLATDQENEMDIDNRVKSAIQKKGAAVDDFVILVPINPRGEYDYDMPANQFLSNIDMFVIKKRSQLK